MGEFCNSKYRCRERLDRGAGGVVVLRIPLGNSLLCLAGSSGSSLSPWPDLCPCLCSLLCRSDAVSISRLGDGDREGIAHSSNISSACVSAIGGQNMARGLKHCILGATGGDQGVTWRSGSSDN